MGALVRCLGLTVMIATAGCPGSHDNSADTDHATQVLQTAGSSVAAKAQALTTNEAEIEQTKRALLRDQQALAERQALLGDQKTQLGSAQGDLQAARAAYTTAVTARFAKLDAALAALATRTDAKSSDALVGLRARRAQLGTKLAAIASTTAPQWTAYTKDVDTTFDAIEHDLDATPRS